MAFTLISLFVFLNMIVFMLLLLFLKMADQCKLVLSGGGENDSILQEPTVPLLNYLRVHKFSEEYANLWGGQHQNVSEDDYSVTLTLDSSSGSGFRSKKPYMYGFFNTAVKLHAGYTAGIITGFYLSNNQVYDGWHDEIDIEFLGTIPGKPYKLQTNVYGNGTGDGIVIGREQQFHLWFDPTQDFHNYSILWTPSQIIFLVDSIPIRRFPKTKSLGVIYPSKPMSVYATIWDASSWATDGGKYKANYSYEPFLASYTDFQTIGCHERDEYCSKVLLDNCFNVSTHLNKEQVLDLKYVRKNYTTYDYCQDFQRYPEGSMPECTPQASTIHTNLSSEV